MVDITPLRNDAWEPIARLHSDVITTLANPVGCGR
jgi:hypothetical protein